MDLPGAAVYTIFIERMTFGFTQVAPPAGNTYFNLFLVLFPEPLLCFGLKNVNQRSVTKIKFVVYISLSDRKSVV